MDIVRTAKLSIAIMIFAGASAVISAAQAYTVLRADYGAGDRRVDVTQQLRQIARSNERFRMGNSTFGTDPAPGQVKTLRIMARGVYGKTRIFEYREGETVDGSQFSGWSGGNWGGGYDQAGAYPGGGYQGGGYGQGRDSGEFIILSAQYGTSRRHVDVTNRLKELARSDRQFRMGNSTFGTDPDPGHEKALRIYARGPNGDQRMFEYREGSVVDGAQFRGWGRGDWGNEGWRGNWDDGRDRDDRRRDDDDRR
jgi:hypothetical protein